MRISLGSALVIVLALAALPAAAVDVRGRVDFWGPKGTIPMARAVVELCRADGHCVRYVTGSDGMYYYSDVRPGPHVVRVNDVERAQVVIPEQARFDIHPIRGN